MTKEYILEEFHDINFFYNDCMKYDTLNSMLDELIEDKILLIKLPYYVKPDKRKAILDDILKSKESGGNNAPLWSRVHLYFKRCRNSGRRRWQE